MRALAVANRRAGKTAQGSNGGSFQSVRTGRTSPLSSSGANIHSDAMVSQRCARTAARTPSAAVIFNRLFIATEVSAFFCLKDQTSLSPRR